MKVGDYVRTKKGEIGKIIGYVDEPTDYYFDCYVTTLKTNFTDTYITEYDNNIKSSPNIIDLIEENDFINGMRITEIKSNKNGVLKCMVDSDYEFITTILNNEIESVLTKQQFSQMEYKVGESDE